MAPVIQCVHQAQAILGEGPVWVPAEQAFYWTDISGSRIHCYHPASEQARTLEAPFRIGSLAPRVNGGFVGGSERGFFVADAGLCHFEVIGDPEPELPGNRVNDGKLDRHGRFWAGTMDDAEEACSGSLYRLEPDLQWSLQDSGYQVPNGPTFSPDGRTMYHTDSARRAVYRFDLTEAGDLKEKALFARFSPEDGHPDGMTTERDGSLWIAFWDGWSIRQLSPAGDVLQTIELPVQRPTSCAFGGERLDVLAVTSARKGLDLAALERQPLAGSLFCIEGAGHGISTPAFAG